MVNSRAIGFIGFGEAGFSLGNGLRDAGVSPIFAYDINSQTPGLGEKIRQRGHLSGTTLVDSSHSLASSCDILLCTVTADAAVEAAEQTLPFLEARHLYTDLNSVSPAIKRTIEAIVTSSGARFVEAAIMSPVPRHGHRVPISLGGVHAQALVDLLGPFGMRLDVISDQVGAASAVKMCRSIIVKGLEALLFECALGASRYGADERVFASLDETFPGMNWSKLAGYAIGRVAEHGARRAREMEEVAETLRAVGVEPMMAEATSRRQEWGSRLNLLEHFGGKAPEDYREVVRAIKEVVGGEWKSG